MPVPGKEAVLPILPLVKTSQYYDSITLMLVARELTKMNGILPRLNTGIAHKTPGIGQVGAGVLLAPEQAFVAAFERLKEFC